MPKNNYMLIVTSLLDEHHCAVRRSSNTYEETFDRVGLVRTDAWVKEPSKLFGLSNCLFGIFTEAHPKYKPDKSFSDYWNPGETITQSVNITFEVFDEAVPIFFKIKKIHEKDFPYTKSKESAQNTKELIGKSYIEHRPTKANFWHFEILIKDETNQEIKESDSKWKQLAANSYIDHALKRATLKRDEKPNNITINKALYKSNKICDRFIVLRKSIKQIIIHNCCRQKNGRHT